MSSVDIANIIQTAYSITSGCPKKNVKIENITEVGTGTYSYDAAIYFYKHQEEQSNVFFAEVENSATFNDSIKLAIETSNPNLNVTSIVDTSSDKFSRSLNKGQSKPQFDRIVPTIETNSFQIQLDNPDYIEIADVSCIKSSSGVTTSFVINTNVLNENILWRIKLANQELRNESNFNEFLMTSNPDQKQSYVAAPNNGNTIISNKQISKAFSTADPSGALVTFDPNVTHYIYIMIYLENLPDFKAIYTQILYNGS